MSRSALRLWSSSWIKSKSSTTAVEMTIRVEMANRVEMAIRAEMANRAEMAIRAEMANRVEMAIRAEMAIRVEIATAAAERDRPSSTPAWFSRRLGSTGSTFGRAGVVLHERFVLFRPWPGL